MILNKEQRDEYEKLVVPVMEFLDRNYHPHVKLIVDSAHAELVEGVCGVPNKKYAPVDCVEEGKQDGK